MPRGSLRGRRLARRSPERRSHDRRARGPAVGLRSLTPTIIAVAGRPALWATAVAQIRVLAAPGWWRRDPYLPLPDPDWLRFRMETAYGDPEAAPRSADVVRWLRWCRETGSVR